MIRCVEEFADLQDDAVRTEFFDFLNVFDDRWPFGDPVFVQQSAGVIVVVVHAPDNEAFGRFVANEVAFIVTDSDVVQSNT